MMVSRLSRASTAVRLVREGGGREGREGTTPLTVSTPKTPAISSDSTFPPVTRDGWSIIVKTDDDDGAMEEKTDIENGENKAEVGKDGNIDAIEGGVERPMQEEAEEDGRPRQGLIESTSAISEIRENVGSHEVYGRDDGL